MGEATGTDSGKNGGINPASSIIVLDKIPSNTTDSKVSYNDYEKKLKYFIIYLRK